MRLTLQMLAELQEMKIFFASISNPDTVAPKHMNQKLIHVSKKYDDQIRTNKSRLKCMFSQTTVKVIFFGNL